jgi:aminoglycoside 3'-phosphotransferase II
MRQRDQPPDAPPSLRAALVDTEWQPITIGMSGAQVYRVVAPGRPPCYLKTASGPRVEELRAERDRLRWLRSRLSVPDVCGWAETEDGAEQRGWLLLTEAPGLMACDPAMMADQPRLVTALAEGLRAIHRLPIAGCPFDARLDARLAQAQWVIRTGIADEAAVREGLGISALELLRRLTVTRPAEPCADLVFTHGDYCLPNLLLDPHSCHLTAYLDWGRAGVADRYQDLAIGARSVRHNLGSVWEPHFLAAYGLSPLDHERIAWYETLDELF